MYCVSVEMPVNCTLHTPSNPFFSSSCMGYHIKGLLPTGRSALGHVSVSGYMRDPLPPARITGCSSIAMLLDTFKLRLFLLPQWACRFNMGELVAGVGDEFAVVLPVMLACVASMVAMVWWMSRGRDNRHVHPQQVRENHQTSVSC